MKTLYSILDYERMKSDLDGCPHNRIEVAAVEMALDEIPEQYKQAIWNNIFYKEKFPERGKQLSIAKSKFVYLVAQYNDWL